MNGFCGECGIEPVEGLNFGRLSGRWGIGVSQLLNVAGLRGKPNLYLTQT